jgi:plastocyanin
VRLAGVLAGALALALAGAAAADSPTADVTIPGKFYAPSDLSVLVDTTVTWRNGDASTHTVTADDDSFDSGRLPPGGTFVRTFAQPGTYKFHCTIHRFMHGVVRVYAVVLVGPDHPLIVGAAAVLTGLAPASARTVVLQRRQGSTWQSVKQVAPTAGAYRFVLSVRGPALYRTVAGRTASPVVIVHARPHVGAQIAGRSVNVTTSPPRSGARAVLQVYEREHFTFVPFAQTRLDGHGRARLPLPADLPAHIRVVVRGTQGWSDSPSRVLLVR